MAKSATKFRLSDLSAAMFAEAARADPVILLPLGSHEDHGPHLPMGDYRLADLLAERIAAAATHAGIKTFVAPCLPFGAVDYFGASPGGLALSTNCFRHVLNELLEGFLRHGLTKIVILNGHGGNVPIIHEVTLRIRHEKNLVIPSFYLWKIARQLMLERVGSEQACRFGHGAEPLLSITKALRGDCIPPAGGLPDRPKVEMLGLPVVNFGTLDFHGLPIDAPVEFDQVPKDAIQSAWPMASTELGAEVAASLVEAAAKFVVHFAKAASISGVSASRSTASDPT